MILKNCLILLAFLFGCILTTAKAYSKHDGGQVQNTSNNAALYDPIALPNDERNDPALLQQKVKVRKHNALNNMDINSETDVSLKSVQNISDNQLSNEYTSIEHEDEDYGILGETINNNTPIQSAKENARLLAMEEEDESKTLLNKTNRIGRFFATTAAPEYTRKIIDKKPNSATKDINVSNSDYIEGEDEILDLMLKEHTAKEPKNINLNNSNKKNDEIVPLAMKYYDDISLKNSSSSLHVEKVNSEDYYEEEYHEHELTTATSIINGTSNTKINFTITTTKPTTSPNNNPITRQFDLSLLTTLAPLTQPSHRTRTQTVMGITTSHTTSADATAASAAINDKKSKQIPISSTIPVITTTAATISRRRLLPHEQLRNYIEDAYIRMPLAVIVDPSADSLERTKALWNEAMRTNLNIKIVLVTLNESEEMPAAFNFNNTRQFLAGLNSIKEQYSGDAFRGISHAAELVPYDSAVFISTPKLAKHTDQVQDSAITLLKKRIRLYLIWFGERSLSENETQDSVGGILGEVATRSGGEILHIVGSENSQELEGSTLTIVADALRGTQEVDVPVDTTLSSLHVKIDKLMRRAILETPNGEINLKKLVKFKSHSLTKLDDDYRLDAYVPIIKLRKATVYKLKVVPENLTMEYSVFIRGERKADTFLDDMIKHFETYFFDGHTSYPARVRDIKLRNIISAVGVATGPTHEKIQFPNNVNSQPKNEVEIFSTQEVHQNNLNDSKNNLSSLAATTTTVPHPRNTNILKRSDTKIEMGTQSKILIAPGMISQLYFEVTNSGYEAVYYTIQVVDERRYLMKLTPQSLFLRAGQTTTVTVTVLVPQNTAEGTIDHITFSTTGAGTTTSLTLNLKVITRMDAQDDTPPSVSWSFGSRCEGLSADFNSCSERFWSMFINAQDWETGIMRLQCTPSAGLIYSKTYTVGSTEPLKATYVASCCEPKVSLVAYDAAGNQRSYTIDVRDLVLTEASVAAIVLGTLLLILLSILIIAAIVWCCRRRKVVLDLPTYRSHSTRSME